jgi:hypothetical protein
MTLRHKRSRFYRGRLRNCVLVLCWQGDCSFRATPFSHPSSIAGIHDSEGAVCGAVKLDNVLLQALQDTKTGAPITMADLEGL